jgi:serine/threonine protein kinase
VARRRNIGDLVFLKTKRANVEFATESLRSEFNLLHSLEHPNIVSVIEFVRVATGPILVMEYERAQPLSKIVKCNGKLSQAECSLIASNIASAVDYLAVRRIAHRDISPENVLLKRPIDAESRRLAVVLVGFTKARTDRGQEPESSGDGTPDRQASDMASDVWGVGTVTAALLAGCPVDEICDMKRIIVVQKETFLYSGCPWVFDLSEILPSTEAADFVESACTVSPVKRPVIGQLLEHPFLRQHLLCKGPQEMFEWL